MVRFLISEIYIAMDVRTLSSNNVKHSLQKFSEWIALPDRLGDEKINTLKYAARHEKKWITLSKNNNLLSYINSVSIALIGDNLYKINGLIRLRLWDKGLLEKPDNLIVSIYSLDKESYDELIHILYPEALKNVSQNKILEYYDRLHLSFKSARIKHGYISDAINIALRGEPRTLQDKRVIKQEVNIERAIDIFKNELTMIDNIDPDSALFSTGILAGALIMLSIDPDNIYFFIRLNKYQGETRNDFADPVESLIRIIEGLRQKKKSVSEGKIQIELCSKTVRSVQLWNAGKDSKKYWLKRLASVDFLPDIRKMKMVKKIHGIREL